MAQDEVVLNETSAMAVCSMEPYIAPELRAILDRAAHLHPLRLAVVEAAKRYQRHMDNLPSVEEMSDAEVCDRGNALESSLGAAVDVLLAAEGEQG